VLPRRIVIFSNEMQPLGGVGKFCSVMLNGLAQRGYEVCWIGLTPALDPTRYELPSSAKLVTVYEEAPEHYTPSRAELRHLKSKNKEKNLDARKAAKRILRDRAIQKLSSLISTFDQDTVILVTQVFCMEHLLEAGLEWGLPNQARVIAQYHDSFESAKESSNLRRIRNSYIEADAFLLLSEVDAMEFEDAGMPNTGYIYNPVLPVDYQVQEKEQLVVSLGRYHQQKGLDQLIEAWSLLVADFPGWVLKLYGEGPLRGDLQAQIESRGLTSTVSLAGHVADIGSVLRSASINVMTSRHEGLPLVIPEAAQYEVPTIAYDCAPGMSVLIDDGRTGTLVPQDDVVEFAQVLRSYMSNETETRRRGREARDFARRFELSSILDEWQQIFESL